MILYVSLNSSYVQEKIAAIASQELQDCLGTEVKIGGASFELFNRITLRDVYLADQKNDTLLYASRISAGLDILPLLKNRFAFSTVQLFGFHAHLKKDSANAPFNFQFVIDAFKSKDPNKKPSKIDLHFNSILIRRGHVTYDILSEPETPDKFNAKHIDISKLIGTITVKNFTNDSLNVDLRKLSFEEKTGFSLNKLTFKAVANKEKALISNFSIELPNTKLTLDSIFANYDLANDSSSFIENANFDVKIQPSKVALKDFSAFVPAFRYFSDQLTISSHIRGSLSNLFMDYLELEYDEDMHLSANMNVKDALRKGETFLSGKVERLYISSQKINDIANNFSKDGVQLPPMIYKLGTVNFKGDISGYLDDLVTYGNFSTALGDFSTDLMIGYGEDIRTFKGTLKTDSFKLGTLLGKENILGKVSLRVLLDVSQRKGATLPDGLVKGTISNIQLKGYDYQNIEMDGHFSVNGFNGKISLDDPNGKINIAGLMDLKQKLPVFNLNMNVEHLRLGELNLTNKYKYSDLSFNLVTNFQGDHIDNGQGYIHIDDLNFRNNDDTISLKKIALEIKGDNPERILTVRSDVLNGEISGSYNFKTLLQDFQQIAAQYIPTFIDPEKFNAKRMDNNFTGQFIVENTENISKTFEIPFTVLNQATLLADYNGELGKFKVEAYIPRAKFKNTDLASGKFVFDNAGTAMNASAYFKNINVNNGNFMEVNLTASAQNDSVFANVGFNNSDTTKISTGHINASAKFSRDVETGLKTTVYIHPSELRLTGVPFFVNPSQIEINAGKIAVNQFSIENRKNEHIKINGIYSNTKTDTLYLDLLNTKLDYIGLITNNEVLDFGGIATGKFNVIGKGEGMPIATADLLVKDFSYNKAVVGDLKIFSTWNENNQGILLDGNIEQSGHKPTKVYGYIFPTKDSLNLSFDANHLNLKLLNPFIKNIMKDFSGWAYGKVNMYGRFKTLSFVGTPYIDDVKFGIEFLNTNFSLSDTLYMTTTGIRLRNATLYDSQNHKGVVNAVINHQYFKNFTYSVFVRAENMLVFNATQKQNPVFFGPIYGSGSATLRGDLDKINIDVDMKSEPNSKLYLSFFESVSAATHDFITFVDKKNPEETEAGTKKKISLNTAPQSKFEMKMTIRVEATPDASVQLIMDSRTNDYLKGKGRGDMRLEYNSRTDDLALYGTYLIEQGNYNFTWEEFIKKDFTIRSGSTVTFRGDPYAAQLNIYASYSLSADISSLDENLGKEMNRQNIPVDAIVHISGNIEHPDITSSIELPTASEDVKRKVNSLIYTQDDVTKQLFYLLLFGRFNPPDHVTVSNSNSAQLALVVSSLSSQLNSILGQLSDKFSIGTNIYSGNTGGVQDLEVGLNISTQMFNNRLILKSNLGYRDNIYTQTNFIGDFDAEYKLTKSGDFRLKGYSHYNDNSLYYGRSGLTTQGLGVMFTKDFGIFSDLFKRKTVADTINTNLTPNVRSSVLQSTDSVKVIRSDKE